MENTLRHTPLFAEHRALNARIVDFAGWAMPVMYGGILEEARAVRNDAGIFDISHMGRIRIHGDGATRLLQSLTTNDVAALKPSFAQYSLLTNPDGGVIDDIIVYREGDEAYMVVINASNTDKDIDWIRQHLPAGVALDDMTEQTAMIAVQGPNAPQMVADLAQIPQLLDLTRFQYAVGTGETADTIFCRTGYTGEDGFELIVSADTAPALWRKLIESGAVPCGLGSRDALRIEAGYPLYGHEIDDMTTPVEAGLMWVVKPSKGTFTGSDKIAQVKKDGATRKLVGLLSSERTQPRQGYNLLAGDDVIGTVTSGVFSPIRNVSVAMGYIESEYAAPGTQVTIDVRGKRIPAMVVPKKDLLTAEV